MCAGIGGGMGCGGGEPAPGGSAGAGGSVFGAGGAGSDSGAAAVGMGGAGGVSRDALPPPAAVGPCADAPLPAIIERRTYTGYGFFLGETGEGRWDTDHHVLNLGEVPADIGGEYTFHVQDAVQYPLTPLTRIFANHKDIELAAGTLGEVGGTFTAPFAMDLVVLASHMHEHGLVFEMRFFDGQRTWDEPLYVSDKWDSPKAQIMDPPLRLQRGQGISYRCSFENFEDHTLVWGTTKGYEMCSLWLYYAYPRGHGYLGARPPELGGDNHTDGSVVELAYGASRETSVIGNLARRAHRDNSLAAANACPEGLASSDEAGAPDEAVNAGCPFLTDPCFRCIGLTCGASYQSCQADAVCQGASGVATVCLCDAQEAGDAAAATACGDSLAASGATGATFVGCMRDNCSVCGL